MDDLVVRQQREIEILRERIIQLEEALAPTTIDVPVEWRLTASEARVYAHLASRPAVTKQSIMLALYCNRPDVEPEIKIVDVFICKLRKKVSPFGVVINTVWGQGYSLASSQKEAA